MRVGLLWNKGTVTDAFCGDIRNRVISDLEEAVGEDEAIGRYSQHGAFAANFIDKFIDLFIIEHRWRR